MARRRQSSRVFFSSLACLDVRIGFGVADCLGLLQWPEAAETPAGTVAHEDIEHAD